MADNYTILAGTVPVHPHSLCPFDPQVRQFLGVLSKELLRMPASGTDASWQALGFWLRPRHLDALAQQITQLDQRLGRGLIFHVTPTNMPAMFMYSWIISLLAGNSNLVRLSPRMVDNTRPVWTLVKRLLEQEDFQFLNSQNAIITYGHDKALTDHFSQCCDGRIIWGGDGTIDAIRQSPLAPKAVELPFADRYSLALLDADTILDCPDDELSALVHRFYNDTFDVDQNACSSPRYILWYTKDTNRFAAAQERWWKAVEIESQAYPLEPIKASRKYTDCWQFLMTYPQITTFQQYGNALYIYTLPELPESLIPFSGAFGQFFQSPLASLDDLAPLMDKKIQTLSIYGIAKDDIRQLIRAKGTFGIDRIVTIGEAMQMDIIWDGTNMIEYLSRIIR